MLRDGDWIMNIRAEKIFLILLTLLFSAGAAHAKGPQNVFNTPHNLSALPGGTGDGWIADNEQGVCLFCHTPHGGSPTGPLWNRSNPTGAAFQHYNSATLSNTLRALSATRPVNDESLLCLSCHDGAMFVNQVINPSNANGGNQPKFGGIDMSMSDLILFGTFNESIIGDSKDAFGNSTGSSRDLRDDHPISFSYYLVQTEVGMDAKLEPVATAEGRGVRFFPIGKDADGTQSTKRLECSSCHDPHVDYDAYQDGTGDAAFTPFLVTSNGASRLCLACHIK